MEHIGSAIGLILLVGFFMVACDPEGTREIYDTITSPTQEARE